MGNWFDPLPVDVIFRLQEGAAGLQPGSHTENPDRVGDLIKVFSGISDELHNHYLLAYTPKRPPDSSWRAIEVRLKNRDDEIRVRKGYFAVKRRRPATPAVPTGGN